MTQTEGQMVICPDCGYENIPGEDECEKCGQSLTDLTESEPASPLERGLVNDSIAALNPRPPFSVTSDTKIGDVLNMLVDNHIGCVLVVDDGELVGIFSERDVLVRLNTEASQLKEEPVSKFMTPSPGTLELGDKVAFAVHKMALGGYRHVPILVDGKPQGIISIRDFLNYATEKLLAEG